MFCAKARLGRFLPRHVSTFWRCSHRHFRTARSNVPKNWPRRLAVAALGIASVSTAGLWLYAEPPKKIASPPPKKEKKEEDKGCPVLEAETTFAPNVPPPITRNFSVLLKVRMKALVRDLPLDDNHDYEFWTFNGRVPGPFIRARVGDVLEVNLTNEDSSGMEHNLDFHAVSGPGGGSSVLTTKTGDTRQGWFKLLQPGLFIYHCSVEPVGVHITNGMYGLVLVEPEGGLPRVDREFYVLQGELYAEESSSQEPNKLELSFERALNENPTHVVFNGRVGALSADGNHLQVKTGEKVRIFFGNIGPNLVSSFHIIGIIFDKVYREADLVSPPARSLQTTLVPAGGATVVEFTPQVPGIYTLVDHSIMRIEKGAVGFLNASGPPNPDIYDSSHPPEPCEGCKIHP